MNQRVGVDTFHGGSHGQRGLPSSAAGFCCRNTDSWAHALPAGEKGVSHRFMDGAWPCCGGRNCEVEGLVDPLAGGFEKNAQIEPYFDGVACGHPGYYWIRGDVGKPDFRPPNEARLQDNGS